MKASQNCYNLIKLFEACRLKAYPDPGTGGLPITIGWGSTMRKDGTRFLLGDRINKEQADSLLEWEVINKGWIVDALTYKANLNQNQFDALVCFAYNVGISALEGSTLLRFIRNNPNNPAIPDEFARWNKSGGKVMAGLIKRRAAEAKLYTSIISK